MNKTGFIILYAITWILTYISAPIKIASIPLNIPIDDIFKIVAVILGVVYLVMSIITFKWGAKVGKAWLGFFPIISGAFDIINVPIIPSIICLVVLIIGSISTISTGVKDSVNNAS
jgi:hypothetical protein